MQNLLTLLRLRRGVKIRTSEFLGGGEVSELARHSPPPRNPLARIPTPRRKRRGVRQFLQFLQLPKKRCRKQDIEKLFFQLPTSASSFLRAAKTLLSAPLKLVAAAAAKLSRQAGLQKPTIFPR